MEPEKKPDRVLFCLAIAAIVLIALKLCVRAVNVSGYHYLPEIETAFNGAFPYALALLGAILIVVIRLRTPLDKAHRH